MKVEILEFVEGARNAKGVTVIIDVFRAFSTACYAYESGATRIIATSEVSKAFDLKKAYHHSVLAGERDEKKIPGFDLGNSPTEIMRTDLSNMTFIQTTTAGTNGLINAVSAEILLTGSLVNAGAIIRFIRELDPPLVSLVAMGYKATVTAEEDIICADIIKSGLTGESKDFKTLIENLRFSAGNRFFNPANLEFSPPSDFFLCTMVNRFDFVLKAERRDDGNIDLARIDL
jgi:2-phosphosulfolactate phosphatase